jgi:SAM-dependent methyltransferase
MNDSPPTLQTLQTAYQLIVEREPKDPELLRRLLKKSTDLRGARDLLFRLPEIQEIVSAYSPNAKPLNGPKMDVEVQVTDEILQRMFKRIEAVFQKNASEEPYFTVSTLEEFKMTSIEETKQGFFARGKQQISLIKAFASRAGIDLGSLRSCFELGCGVGRVTVWLAELFPQVFAWDISEHMLNEARNTMSSFGRTNVSFHRCNNFSDFQNLPEFDFFFTIIVLQHNPPPVINYMLGCILDRLSPGGVGLFQVPTYRANYTFSAQSYLSEESQDNKIEMHFFPQAELFRLIEEKGCHVLEIRENGRKRRVSNIVFIQKRRR